MRETTVIKNILCASAAAALLCLNCADLSGGGSEAGNARLIGMVVTDQGSPAGGVIVSVAPSEFDPVKGSPLSAGLTDTTAADGMYGFIVQKGGAYTVQAVQMTARTRGLTAGMEVVDTDIAAPPCTLNAPGAVKVMLPYGADPVYGYVYIPGTACFEFLNGGGDSAVLDSVPAGTVPAIYTSSTNDSAAGPIRYHVAVMPGDTAVVYNPSWKYARRLVLNTAPAGADVAGDVAGFPVLVRLSGGNFDFSQAQPGGADIRFTKPDNSFLPCEVQQWNAGSAAAELWVRVDTVRGDDSSQSIWMYWGNAAAADGSDGAAVFNAGNGFTAVWHLGADCSDASAGDHHGTNYGAADAAGLIGAAKRFDGRDSIRIPGLLGTPSSVTLSGWFRTDTAVTYGQEIVSIGNCVLIRAEEVDTAGAGAYYLGGNDLFVPVTSGTFFAKTGWHHVAFTFNNSNFTGSLYIDGALAKSHTGASAIKYTGQSSNTYIGAHGNGQQWFNSRGTIDEARVCGCVRSADWIRLCYMNQRAADRLVVFK